MAHEFHGSDCWWSIRSSDDLEGHGSRKVDWIYWIMILQMTPQCLFGYLLWPLKNAKNLLSNNVIKLSNNSKNVYDWLLSTAPAFSVFLSFCCRFSVTLQHSPGITTQWLVHSWVLELGFGLSQALAFRAEHARFPSVSGAFFLLPNFARISFLEVFASKRGYNSSSPPQKKMQHFPWWVYNIHFSCYYLVGFWFNLHFGSPKVLCFPGGLLVQSTSATSSLQFPRQHLPDVHWTILNDIW